MVSRSGGETSESTRARATACATRFGRLGVCVIRHREQHHQLAIESSVRLTCGAYSYALLRKHSPIWMYDNHANHASEHATMT